MSRWELKNQAKGALRDNFGSKMLLFIIPIIMGILGGGNGMKQSMDYNGSFDNVPSSVWMAVSFATLLIVILMIVVALFVSVVTVGAIFNYIKIFRGERNNPQFKNVFGPFYDGSAGKIILLNIVKGIIFVVLMFIPIIGWAFGIYLALGWSQSTYVLFDQLEEDRYSGVMNVLSESATMMKGLRGDYFIFKFSFFWWYVLYGISGGLAGFWTTPYLNMASIAYYENIGK
ncbi:DUF975 family protein [Lactococcus cremoris]|uniref:DUF975 family protein n=1 Tax=Lactococcus lactis subsp. cremoris TaxID=1359 RepID=A0ABR5EFK4_LACLC|nr:DUF975 family protein [Lactococcus cremoris]KKW71588.1 hypothetical protein VN93_1647 [Lactococcus cremoris]MCD6631360.1 DUF975 family protein [Lactococcus cremoris]TNU82565.1 DUF975 family protein [Lactococcus cremoris]